MINGSLSEDYITDLIVKKEQALEIIQNRKNNILTLAPWFLLKKKILGKSYYTIESYRGCFELFLIKDNEIYGYTKNSISVFVSQILVLTLALIVTLAVPIFTGVASIIKAILCAVEFTIFYKNQNLPEKLNNSKLEFAISYIEEKLNIDNSVKKSIKSDSSCELKINYDIALTRAYE